MLFFWGGCAVRDSYDSVKRDHARISAMLDAALLSKEPKLSFTALIDTVGSFPSVDSAWVEGTTFFVKYRDGGTLMWTAPPPINESPSKGEQQP